MHPWCSVVMCVALLKASATTPGVMKMEVKETFDRDYWYTQAQETLSRRLQFAPDDKPIAKNIILVVGDGMSLSTATAARILRGQRRGLTGEETDLIWDTFPAIALAKTYNLDAQTGESSACATALVCGVKARFETLGLDAGGRFNNCLSSVRSKVNSLVDWAHAAGKSSGVVTTARVTHATPAALFAHAPSRYWEDDSRVPPTVRKSCKDIAMQMVEDEPGRSMSVIMGGGRRHFLPNIMTDPENTERDGRRLDGRNLAADWLRDKSRRKLRAAYVYGREQLSKLDLRSVDYLLGLFGYSHMDFNTEREAGATDDPSLAEMTRAALTLLQRNNKGFFLLIEGGRIDHAHHVNNPYRALDETLEMETALLAVLERVNLDDTLVVVTADHGHVMSVGGQNTPRGNPILGADTALSDVDSLPYTSIVYGSGPGHAEPRAVPHNGTPPTAVHAAAVPRQWATHGAEDVPVYATGPLATTLFGGVIEQSYLPHAMAYAACLAHHAKRCTEKNNTTQAKVKDPTCVAPEVSSVSVAEGSRTPSVETSGARRVIVASSVMSEERPPRSQACILKGHLVFSLTVHILIKLRQP